MQIRKVTVGCFLSATIVLAGVLGTLVVKDIELQKNSLLDNEEIQTIESETGWQQQGSDWYYYDESGNPVQNEWVEQYYYIGEDGKMVRNQYVDRFFVSQYGNWNPRFEAPYWLMHGEWKKNGNAWSYQYNGIVQTMDFSQIRSIYRLGYDTSNEKTPPEQSEEAYRLAAEKGFTIVLCDLCFTKGNEIFNIRHFLTQLYDINWNGSYWYLYAYIPLLVSLPLLQNIAQNLSNKNFIYLFVVYAIYNMCLPSIQYLLWNGRHDLNGNAVLHWISYNIFIFPLAGYFFEHRVKEFWNKRKILFLWGINIGVILFSCYLTYFKAKTSQGDDIMYSQTFHNTFVLVNGITLFVTLQYINSHTNLFLKMEKVICSLGQCTFGIYLLHIFIKDELNTVGCQTPGTKL